MTTDTKHRAETWTHAVERVLRVQDDLITISDLVLVTRGTRHQIQSACEWLVKHCVIGFVTVNDADATRYYYALPPEYDTRSRVVIERVPDVKRSSRKLHSVRTRKVYEP